MHPYGNLDVLPEDPILGVAPLFKADARPEKINLGIGAYQDEKGKPVVLEAVRQAEEIILNQRLDKEYLPILGDALFVEVILKVVLGEDIDCVKEQRVATAQTVGDSGAIRIAGELLKECGYDTVYLSTPTWTNHFGIFKHAGLVTAEYPYYDPDLKGVNFAKLCHAIERMPASSAILLQGSCHNPTGAGLSVNQWNILSELFKKHKVQPIFDLAYQGLGQGLEEDAYGVRLFAKEHTPIICSSFSKNFGLYGERIGLLAIVLPEKKYHSAVITHVKHLIRGNYSMPPLHGARIIRTILNTPELARTWRNQLDSMRERLQTLRKELKNAMEAEGGTRDYSFYTQGEGFFSLTGLTREQVLWLRKERGIYMPEIGRINIAGLNSHNIPPTAKALVEAERQ